MRIKRNRARCQNCGDIIESKYRHDFVGCECGDIFLDGGTSYVRIGWKPGAGMEMLTEYYEDSDE